MLQKQKCFLDITCESCRKNAANAYRKLIIFKLEKLYLSFIQSLFPIIFSVFHYHLSERAEKTVAIRRNVIDAILVSVVACSLIYVKNVPSQV